MIRTVSYGHVLTDLFTSDRISQFIQMRRMIPSVRNPDRTLLIGEPHDITNVLKQEEIEN